MNRRKIPSLSTKEDRLIWLRLNLPLRRPTPKKMVSAAYREADRRDAALMFNAMRTGFLEVWFDDDNEVMSDFTVWFFR